MKDKTNIILHYLFIVFHNIRLTLKPVYVIITNKINPYPTLTKNDNSISEFYNNTEINESGMLALSIILSIYWIFTSSIFHKHKYEPVTTFLKRCSCSRYK